MMMPAALCTRESAMYPSTAACGFGVASMVPRSGTQAESVQPVALWIVELKSGMHAKPLRGTLICSSLSRCHIVVVGGSGHLVLQHVLVLWVRLPFHLHEDTLRQVLEDDLWLCTALNTRCIFFV